MGLDVIALSDAIRLAKNQDMQREGENVYEVIVIPEFNWHDDIISGTYKSIGEPFHFYAGSYSGYNKFRLYLFLAVNKISEDDIYTNSEKYKDFPFSQLLYAQYDQAIYGSKTSEILFKNFIKYQDVAIRSLSRFNPLSVGLYNNFAKAFKIASESNNGMVIFG
jgi:hypothetical protein